MCVYVVKTHKASIWLKGQRQDLGSETIFSALFYSFTEDSGPLEPIERMVFFKIELQYASNFSPENPVPQECKVWEAVI